MRGNTVLSEARNLLDIPFPELPTPELPDLPKIDIPDFSNYIPTLPELEVPEIPDLPKLTFPTMPSLTPTEIPWIAVSPSFIDWHYKRTCYMNSFYIICDSVCYFQKSLTCGGTVVYVLFYFKCGVIYFKVVWFAISINVLYYWLMIIRLHDLVWSSAGELPFVVVVVIINWWRQSLWFLSALKYGFIDYWNMIKI